VGLFTIVARRVNPKTKVTQPNIKLDGGDSSVAHVDVVVLSLLHHDEMQFLRAPREANAHVFALVASHPHADQVENAPDGG
jgi:hypothetical protein